MESIRELQHYRAKLFAPAYRGLLAGAAPANGPVGCARNIQVSTTVSGLSDMLSIP